VVIFGLMIATILTLVVVPTLYALIENAKLKTADGYGKTRAFFLGPDPGTGSR
jgi:hypothetical protein